MTDLSNVLPGVPTPVIARNAIINGDMRIAQRGTSFAAFGSSNYCLDRWQYYKSGAMVHTISQVDKSSLSSDTPNDQFEYAMKFDCTTADTSISATDYCLICQKVEGYNFRQFVGQTATISFWVKAGKTGTMCVVFVSSANDRSYVAEVIINQANTWEYKTVTLDFDYSGGTWDYTNGIGVQMYLVLAGGSTYQTTPDTWQSGLYFSTSNQTNFCDNTDATCDVWITGVQLELGANANDFVFDDQSVLENKCRRYYWRHIADKEGVQGSGYFTNGLIWSATKSIHVYRFPIEMRSSPTFSYSGSFRVQDGTSHTVSAFTGQNLNPNSARIDSTITGGGTGNGAILGGNSDASAYLEFKAEL